MVLKSLNRAGAEKALCGYGIVGSITEKNVAILPGTEPERLLSFRAIVRILGLDQEVIFDLSVILGVTGIAFLFCLCLSALLVNHFMRSSIYELLQKERG